MKTIAVISRKGGSGKTTVATSLAIAGFLRGQKVCLADTDPQRSSVEVLKMAKAKGCKFTMSGLVPKESMEQSNYVFEVLKSAGLDFRDFYVPGM